MNSKVGEFHEGVLPSIPLFQSLQVETTSQRQIQEEGWLKGSAPPPRWALPFLA